MISKAKKYYYAGQITGAITALNIASNGDYNVILLLSPGEDETFQDISKCISWAADIVVDEDNILYAKRTDDGYKIGFCDASNQDNFISNGYIEVKPATYEELWPSSTGEVTED